MCTCGNHGKVLDCAQTLDSATFKNCRKWKPDVCAQVKAPLPKRRVTAGFREFSCTGVDFFGLFLENVGRKRAKR